MTRTTGDDCWTPGSHPYGAFLHEIQKPARYIGGEFHSIRKPWRETSIHVALAFPDLYEIGMSHLGLRILYDQLNADPRIAAERVFAPWKDLERKLRENELPLVSLESARPLADFDVIGFSLQYELTYTNVLNMLDLSGLPLRSEARDGRHPLVVAGGPQAAQPEPMAPFIDAFLVGDGEHHFARFLESFMRWREEGLNRREILVRLAGLGGVYCPSLYDTEVEARTGGTVVGSPRHEGVPTRVRRNIVPDLVPYPFPSLGPVPSMEIVFDRFSMEIGRGCTEGCRFCQAGILYRPVRERSPDEILDTLAEAIRGSGYDAVSLTALSTADFSCISPLVRKLMDHLREEKVSLAVSSLRAYGLPDDLLDSIAEVRNTSLTLAPEAGSARLRDVINKNISEEDMQRSAHAIFSRGWKRCKLYFMIGLPTEEDTDVLAIIETARKYLEIGRQYRRGAGCEITASVSTHVPKPHTPFQWARMDSIPEILRKQALLQKGAEGTRILLKWHDAESSHLEGILSRGDRRVADLVERAFQDGCRFDGWSSEFRFDVWMRGLEDLGLERSAYLREIPLDSRLPWDHIETGIDPGFLAKEYRRALDGMRSPPCGKPVGAKVHATNLEDASSDTRKLVCHGCGLECDLEALKEGRSDFLRRLQAFGRPCAGSPAEGAGGAGSLDDLRARNRRPRTAIVNKTFTRYRLLHTKLDKVRFLSHLDIVRMMPRLFRRAGLSMTYSLGFHPKPRMTFSPALPLGWGSRGELFDAYLEEGIEPAELLERLNRASPAGLGFLDARALAADDAPLSRLIHAADYAVALPGDAPREKVAEKLSLLGSGEHLEVLRRKAGRERILTAAPRSVLSATLDEAGLWLFIRLRLDTSPVLRPDDICRFVLGSPCFPQAVERRALWYTGVEVASPMDLEKIRGLMTGLPAR